MKHRASVDDLEFQRKFELCETLPAEFDHAAHVRLAYVYLCEHSVDAAASEMKTALLAFLAHLGIGETKYHETLTRSWVMAVNHFMTQSQMAYVSASEFIEANRDLLDGKIMLTHYSAELLFSPGARQAFVPPDIQAIPPDAPARGV